MGLTFLVPLFLAGLVAVGIPIYIHLSHRVKKEPVAFPSLMFLSRVPYRTVRRQRIRHWPLFLLRSAAVILLAVAFARPLVENALVGTVGLQGARELVILVDNSYSMAYEDRWERALRAARGVVTGLGPEDLASVVVFAAQAEAVNQPTGDQTALLASLDRLSLSNGRTRYSPPLQVAEQILEESRHPVREVVLITDFQKVGWDGETGVHLPDNTTLRRIDVSDPGSSNVAVTSVSVDRVVLGGRERVVVLARLINQSLEAVRDLTVAAEIDGNQVAAQAVDIEPNEVATVRFPAVPIPLREVRGVVRIQPDRLTVDDAFHFVLGPSHSLSVLLVTHPSARPEESLYLQRALEIGRDPPYDVAVRRMGQLGPEDLADRKVVILNDVAFPRGAIGRRLRDWVAAGGGLLIVLGQRSGPGSWTEEVADMLPGRLGGPVDRLADRGGTLNPTDYDHPVFELFSGPRSGDFSQARFFRYRSLQDEGGAGVLARFDDGSVALAETRIGEGRVLVWTSGVANAWNDFPVQPVFLPFVHQITKHLAHFAPPQDWYAVGHVLDLAPFVTDEVEAADPTTLPDVEVVVESPAGERRVTRVTGSSSYTTLDQQGFYRIRSLDGEDREVGVVAVNVDVAESDLTPMDGEELAAAVTFGDEGSGAVMTAGTLTVVERERRQGLWWYLLFTVLILLAVEAAISNRLFPTRTR